MAIAEAGSAIGRPVTEDELMALRDDGYLYELVGGLVVGKPAASFRAGVIAANLTFLLAPYVRGRGAMSCGKGGFRVSNGSVRVPTASFTRKARMPGGHAPKGFGEAAPDLCVEIIRPDEDWADANRKVGEYFDAGASFVWHVFPEAQQVIVFTSPTETQTFEADDLLTAGDLLPGLSCRVSDLFVME